MLLTPIVSRLRTLCPSLASVRHARSRIDVGNDASDVPAVFVHPLNETSGDNQNLQSVVQRRTRNFAVLIAAKISDDGAEPLESARDEIAAALVGFEPTANGEPIVHVSGETVEIDGRLIWWRESFSYVEYIRS